MIRDPHVLLKFLYDNPESWPVRMALIEELVRDGDIEQAKAIIRKSPDDSPMPPEYPLRIHTLMTKGKEGLESLPPLPGFEDRPETEAAPAPEHPVPEPVPSASGATLDEVQEMVSKKSEKIFDLQEDEDHQFTNPTFDFEQRVGEIANDGQLVLPGVKGGAGALVETKTIKRKLAPKPPAPTIDQEIAAIKWEKYAGKLNLTAGALPETVGKPSRYGDRLSAMSLAIIAHCVIAVLVSLVAIHTPRPNPPKLVLTIPDIHEAEDLVVHKLTKPAEIEPSAASMQAVNVVTSIQMSNFNLPEVEDTSMLDVTAMIDGNVAVGAGMKLSLNTHQQSDVNFFGISSGGKKIVFIIDATKPMLVDEKGGMFAYDKVKNEIGAMLSNLNRGTKFNILVYSGKSVQAFREKLVPGLPSNLRLAMEWLNPLNSDYDNLGLPGDFGFPIQVEDIPGLPIAARDIAHYTKCIQKAMEWQAAAIFCISGGYERMRPTHSPEMIAEAMAENPRMPADRGKPDPADQARYERDKAKWDQAVARTRQWLNKENQARKAKGLAPKVVLNFNQLVKDVTGATPPRGQARIGATRGSNPTDDLPPLKPIGFDHIDVQLRKLVIAHYRKQNKSDPSVHMVIFLGEDEEFQDEDKDHFYRITRRNNGKMKMLRGLAALTDVTGK